MSADGRGCHCLDAVVLVGSIGIVLDGRQPGVNHWRSRHPFRRGYPRPAPSWARSNPALDQQRERILVPVTCRVSRVKNRGSRVRRDRFLGRRPPGLGCAMSHALVVVSEQVLRHVIVSSCMCPW